MDFAVGEELGQPRKFELAEELREAVQPDGAEADEEPEHPMQGWGAAFGQAEDEAEEQEAKIDGDIAFTQRDFVARVFITNKLAGYQTVDALRIAQIFQVCDVFKSFDAIKSRFFERIKELFAVEEEGAESKLMAERAVDSINDAGGNFHTGLHQCGRKEGQANVERHEEVEHQQVVSRNPIRDAVGCCDLLSAADARLVGRAADFVQLAAAIGGGAEGHL